MRTLPLFIFFTLLGTQISVHAQAPELIIPTGHAAPVSALALSPDGKLVLSGSLDGEVVLWNREGEQLTSFADLSFFKKKQNILTNIMDVGEEIIMGVSAVAIFSDGRMVTGSKSGNLTFWQADGSREQETSNQGKSINCIKLSPDGQHFASGDDEGNLTYWRINGEKVWTKRKAHSKVNALTFSPDGKELFSGGADRKIIAWNTSNGVELRTFSKAKGLTSVADLDVSPDGKRLIAGNSPRSSYVGGAMLERSAFVFSIEGKVLRELDRHRGIALCVAFTPGSGTPVVGTQSGRVYVYKQNGAPVRMDMHDGEVLQLIADPTAAKADQVISAGADGKVIRFNPNQEETITEYSGLIGRLKGFGVNREEGLELFWYEPDGSGGVFDLSERYIKPIKDVNDPVTNAEIRGLYEGAAEMQDYELGFMGYKTLEKVNKRSGETESSAIVEEHDRSYVRTISIDGARSFAAINFLSDIDTENFGTMEYVASAALADETRRKLISGLYFNYETGEVKKIRGHSKMVISAAISSDNQYLITGSLDKTAILWDAQLNKTVMDGHDAGVTTVAFSPDNSLIVTASEDKRLFIRNGKGRILHSFTDIGFVPRQAVFSRDSRFLFVNDDKPIIHIYDTKNYVKLGRLFLFKGGEWAFIDDDGLFDASDKAMSQMNYVVRGDDGWERLELGQLKTRFFEPNIIGKKLELVEERIRSVEGLTDVPLFPELSANIEDDQLFVKLKSRNGGIGPVSLFVNGKEVKKDANPDRQTAFSIDLRPLQKYLNRQAGSENILALRAYNKDGWLKSSAFTLNYTPVTWQKGQSSDTSTGGGDLETGDPLMFIVSIGTSDYTGEQLDSSFADQDAKSMAIALQSVGKQLFSATDQLEVYCLNTDSESEAALAEKGIQWQFAEKENIKNVFSSISQKASSKDIVMVYLSGHGVTYGSAEKTKFHYLTQGISSEDLSDKAIRDNYTISDEELTNWINDIPALKQVLVIDACNSGKVVEKLTSGTKNLSSGQILALDRMKDRTGMFVISGSAADKVSYESSEFGQGLLTYSLLQGMNGVAVRKTSKGDFIDVMNLFQYARDEVPELAASISGIQTPMLGFPDQGASFDIGIFNDLVEIPIAIQKPVFIRSNFQNEVKFEDDLGIAALIDKRLQDEAGQGADADLVFVDLNQKEGAYSIKGRYHVENGEIVVNVRLFYPDGSSEGLEVSSGGDADRVANLIYRAAKKAIRNK